MAPRVSLKNFPVTSSIHSALDYGYTELESLRDECSEVLEAIPDSLQSGDRYSTFESTKEVLDLVDDKPDWDDVPDAEVTYTENRRRGIGRAKRRDNATSALSAAVDGLRELHSDIDSAHDELEEAWRLLNEEDDRSDQDDEERKVNVETSKTKLATLLGEGGDGDVDDLLQTASDKLSKIDELADKVEEQQGEADGCDFPGMYG